MVVRVIGKEDLKRIKWELVSTVIIHSFQSRDRKEQNSLPSGHPNHQLRQTSTNCIQHEPLQWAIIESTVGIWNIESMVNGMELFVQEGIGVHCSM